MMLKRGSISLSINMIVVVVLAFDMLGLMLSLGRSIIDSARESTLDLSDTVRQQILDDLNQGNKPLSFAQNEISVQFNNERVIPVGIRNNDAGTKYFAVRMYAVDRDGTRIRVNNRARPSINLSGSANESIGEFQYSMQGTLLGPGQSEVLPLKYTARTSNKDNFLFLLVIFKSSAQIDNNKDYFEEGCTGANPSAFCNNLEIHASKTFFMKVT
jgi:hypothetical protein